MAKKLAEIPDELFIFIIQFIAFKPRIRLRTVNKSWASLILRSLETVEFTILHSYIFTDPTSFNALLDTLKRYDLFKSLWIRCTQLSNIHFRSVHISDEVVEKIVNNVNGLKTLTISFVSSMKQLRIYNPSVEKIIFRRFRKLVGDLLIE